MKISYASLPGIVTIDDYYRAYRWCQARLGQPGSGGWQYGRDSENYLGGNILSGPEDIDYIKFDNEEDAIAFKLSFT